MTAVKNWPTPTNVTELRGFLGLACYYRRFIKQYGIICRPLFDCLKKDSFSWGPNQDTAFHQLKQSMTEAPVLALPDFTAPFILEKDASGYGIGAVLMQRGRPIAFLSKTLGPKAAASSIYDKEAMTILEALKKWKHYFASTSLIIRTDQQSLMYIQDQKLVEGIQHKLLIKLLGYNYSVEYKKGKENRATDALSRVLHPKLTMAISTVQPKWMEDVQKSYEQDQACTDLLTKLSVSPQAVPNYSLKNDILRFHGKVVIGGASDLRTQLLQSFHNSALGGHSGERATLQRLKLIFYWPKMKQDVISFVKSL